jgi:DNA primase
MNHDLLMQAKRRLTLIALMSQLGFGDHAKKSARCPFHEDSSASFSVYLGEDGELRWKCFAGCGGGDVIDFLAKHRGISNADACREYITLAGISAPLPEGLKNPTPPRPFDWEPMRAAFTIEHRRKLAAPPIIPLPQM